MAYENIWHTWAFAHAIINSLIVLLMMLLFLLKCVVKANLEWEKDVVQCHVV